VASSKNFWPVNTWATGLRWWLSKVQTVVEPAHEQHVLLETAKSSSGPCSVKGAVPRRRAANTHAGASRREHEDQAAWAAPLRLSSRWPQEKAQETGPEAGPQQGAPRHQVSHGSDQARHCRTRW
jgi:hypothetical protein